MKITITIVLIFISIHTIGQIERTYFFDERLTINDSTSLIVIIREPQTQFAKELNARIYTDTNFMKQLKESWSVEVEGNGAGRMYHRCGHDMYFYKLSGNEFTYLKKLNSNCQTYDIGSANLGVLSEFGKPLHIDTLTRIPFNAHRDDLFTEDLFESYYIDGQNQNWECSKATKYPKIYYEGCFKTRIELDSSRSIFENIDLFLGQYTNDLEGLNWDIENQGKIDDLEKNKTKSTLDLKVYLKQDQFEFFSEYTIEKVDFNIERGSSLVLLFRN